jgi:hypothetical protein
MHSKRYRRQRQRIAANKFQQHNGRRAGPTFWRRSGAAHASAHRFRWFIFLATTTQRQAEKITLGIICEGIHRTKLPCGNHAATGNPVTVRIAPRKSP